MHWREVLHITFDMISDWVTTPCSSLNLDCNLLHSLDYNHFHNHCINFRNHIHCIEFSLHCNRIAVILPYIRFLDIIYHCDDFMNCYSFTKIVIDEKFWMIFFERGEKELSDIEKK